MIENPTILIISSSDPLDLSPCNVYRDMTFGCIGGEKFKTQELKPLQAIATLRCMRQVRLVWRRLARKSGIFRDQLALTEVT